jgi:hypothetical protein
MKREPSQGLLATIEERRTFSGLMSQCRVRRLVIGHGSAVPNSVFWRQAGLLALTFQYIIHHCESIQKFRHSLNPRPVLKNGCHAQMRPTNMDDLEDIVKCSITNGPMWQLGHTAVRKRDSVLELYRMERVDVRDDSPMRESRLFH